MAADIILYGGEPEPNDVRLRSAVVATVVALIGVMASPAVGAGTFNATYVMSGVSASPAIGTGTWKATTAISGVTASPAVGSLTFNVQALIDGVAATPMIGAGTLEIEAGDVVVFLTGVGADPQIGEGTVVTEEGAVTPPVEVPGGAGRPWYGRPEKEAVKLKGVSARPRIGRGIVVTAVADIARLYPFPARQVRPEPVRIPRFIVPRSVQLTGTRPMSGVGTGAVKIVLRLAGPAVNPDELTDEEIIALLEAA